MVRVTQSMLSTNMLRNLNTSYSKMSNYQEMLTSGRKFNRASEDPVAAVKGMKYRVQLDRVQQYQRNMNEANSWLDTTDSALDQVGNVLNRVKELVVQAANDTNTADERGKIKQEIDQIREQLKDVANTQLGEKYIFSGTHTQKPLYVNVEVDDIEAVYNNLTDAEKQTIIQNATSPLGEVDGAAIYNEIRAIAPTPMPTKSVRIENNVTNLTGMYYGETFSISAGDKSITVTDTVGENLTAKTVDILPYAMTATGMSGKVEVEVFNGVQLAVNTSGGPEMFEEIEKVLRSVSEALTDTTKTGKDIGDLLGANGADVQNTIAKLQSKVLDARADVGARMNRVELMTNRLEIQEVNTTKHLSENEDTDYAKTITDMATQESIHQAALSVGAKIIQQTLVDFIR